MIKGFFIWFFIISITVMAGCASTMDKVNKGAEETGKAGGRVMKVPHSVSEGAAEGIKGEPESNPYNR